MDFEKVKQVLYSTYGNSVSYKNDFATSIRECEMIVAKSKERLDLFGITDVEFLCLVLLERNAYEVLQHGISEVNLNSATL